jgi:hypothetical protein
MILRAWAVLHSRCGSRSNHRTSVRHKLSLRTNPPRTSRTSSSPPECTYTHHDTHLAPHHPCMRNRIDLSTKVRAHCTALYDAARHCAALCCGALTSTARGAEPGSSIGSLIAKVGVCVGSFVGVRLVGALLEGEVVKLLYVAFAVVAFAARSALVGVDTVAHATRGQNPARIPLAGNAARGQCLGAPITCIRVRMGHSENTVLPPTGLHRVCLRSLELERFPG